MKTFELSHLCGTCLYKGNSFHYLAFQNHLYSYEVEFVKEISSKMFRNSYFIVICMFLILAHTQAAPRESLPNARLAKRTLCKDLGHDSNCFWEGSSPFCQGECPRGFKLMCKDGWGDTSNYCLTGYKALCCPEKENIWGL
ncbi:Uncharacterized protein APZ42_012067 [Daphnia magna]|uniref:Uncharacterized protein n=2 Tax=Daphnia magna TaxID=35525 RepID=A0A0P6CD94_9CRUS|nr:hypothetical protein OUZ56_013544 [Daphnia magna]KZS20943.1 Uncharacterized protein APZ42_012067 [Daphnia magna]